MELNHEFYKQFGVDLASMGWTIGRHNKTSIDADTKTIWVGTFDDFDEIKYHISFRYSIAIRRAFHLVDQKYELLEASKDIYISCNPSWEYATVGSFLVLRNKTDHKVVALDPSTNDDEVSSHLAHNMFAMSDLADIGKIEILQTTSMSLPTISVDGTVLYPNTIRDYINRNIESWSLIKATDTEVVCLVNKISYESTTRQIVRDCTEFHFVLEGKRVINWRRKVSPSLWTGSIKAEYDFAANPNNKEIWNNIKATVKYESDRLLINDIDQVFIKTEFGWLWVEHTWIEKSDTVSQGLKDEYIMTKSIMNMK